MCNSYLANKWEKRGNKKGESQGADGVFGMLTGFLYPPMFQKKAEKGRLCVLEAPVIPSALPEIFNEELIALARGKGVKHIINLGSATEAGHGCPLDMAGQSVRLRWECLLAPQKHHIGVRLRGWAWETSTGVVKLESMPWKFWGEGQRGTKTSQSWKMSQCRWELQSSC